MNFFIARVHGDKAKLENFNVILHRNKAKVENSKVIFHRNKAKLENLKNSFCTAIRPGSKI